MQRRSFTLLVVFAFCLASSAAHAVEDVMLQTMDGQIVTGIVDDGSGVGAIGARVFGGNFLSNYRAANPGFFSLTSVNPNLPAGVFGFPSQHKVGFDLVPMRLNGSWSNLLYWDGSDAGDNGLDLTDVILAPPTGVEWQVVDGNSALKITSGTDDTVAGGLIQRTSSDANSGDGVDTGLLHKHLALLLNQTTGGTPPAGIYAVAWQANSPGFEASDPFVFVHRTSSVSNAVRDLAVDWFEENLESLFSVALPGDYTEDRIVDAADYTFWRDRLSQSIALPNETASPGIADSEDYDVWQAHFGQSTMGGTREIAVREVPEPATLGAVVTGMSAIIMHLRRPARRGLGSIRR